MTWFKKIGHQDSGPRNGHQGDMPSWCLILDPVLCWSTSPHQIIIWGAPPPYSAGEYFSYKWGILAKLATRGLYWGEEVLLVTGLFYKGNWSRFVLNTLKGRLNNRHFPHDTFKCIFLNKNVSITIKISPKLVPKAPINNISALVQIMAWCHPGDEAIIWINYG